MLFTNKARGTISQIFLLFIFLPGLMFFMSFLPGGADLVQSLFWESLGSFEIFEGAAEAMSTFLDQETIQFDHVLAHFIKSISASFLQAWIIGICVTICIEMCMRQKKKKQWHSGKKNPRNGTFVYIDTLTTGLSGSPILLSTLGVFVGVMIIGMIKQTDSADLQATLYMVISIGLLILGICIMMGLTKKYSLYTPQTIVTHLLKTLLGAAYAFCVAGAVSALMLVPQLLRNGASPWFSLVWYFVMVLFMFLLIVVYKVSDPLK